MDSQVIKRGATFRVDLVLDEQDPWPSEVRAAVSYANGGKSIRLLVTPNIEDRLFSITADTAAWPLGVACFDVLVSIGGDNIPMPWAYNVPLHVIAGVAE